MNVRFQLITFDNNLITWKLISPFLTGMAVVGLGILVSFYLGLL